MNRRTFMVALGLATTALGWPAQAAPHLPGRIVIVQNIGEARALFTVDPNSGALKRIFDKNRQEDGPCISPDGQTLLFSALSGGQGGWRTWAYDFASGRARVIINSDSWPICWLPGGRFIGNIGQDICIVDASGHLEKTLRKDEAMPTTGDVGPGGQLIYGDAQEPVHLQVVDLSSGTARKLCAGGNPVVCPDGRTLLFQDGRGWQRIPIAGGTKSPVAGLPRNASNLHFSPDGKFAAWTSDMAGGGTKIVIATASFQPLKTISVPHGINTMTWGR